MKMLSTGWILGLLVVVGCGGGGGGGGSVSTQPLSGKIGGQPWTFGTGQTNSALSTADQLFVDLYPGTFETCASAEPLDADLVTMNMPTTPGSYPLGLNLIATLYVASATRNYGATSGTLVIDSVTATEISGGLHATYNGDNSVDGQFKATICP